MKKTGKIINCDYCGTAKYKTASLLKKAKTGKHFCSTFCISKYFAQFKKIYPKKVGVCKLCSKDIIAKNASFNKPIRIYCSKKCNRISKNLENNPAWMEGVKEKIAASRRSRPNELYRWSFERRIKWAIRLQGENSHFWKGGLTDKNRGHRNSVQYSIWREEVFKRDNYTCLKCGARNGNGKTVYLNADHIKPWATFPELRFEISNGQTLCLDCHRRTDTFGFRASNLLAH